MRALCKEFDGVVYLAARDEGRGLQAVEDLKKVSVVIWLTIVIFLKLKIHFDLFTQEGLKLTPVYQQLDIDSLESIQRFRDFIKDTHGGFDVLVNNAATAYKVSGFDFNSRRIYYEDKDIQTDR